MKGEREGVGGRSDPIDARPSLPVLQLPCPPCPRVQLPREAGRCDSTSQPFHVWGHYVHRSNYNPYVCEKRKSPRPQRPSVCNLSWWKEERRKTGTLPCSPSKAGDKARRVAVPRKNTYLAGNADLSVREAFGRDDEA